MSRQVVLGNHLFQLRLDANERFSISVFGLAYGLNGQWSARVCSQTELMQSFAMHQVRLYPHMVDMLRTQRASQQGHTVVVRVTVRLSVTNAGFAPQGLPVSLQARNAGMIAPAQFGGPASQARQSGPNLAGPLPVPPRSMGMGGQGVELCCNDPNCLRRQSILAGNNGNGGANRASQQGGPPGHQRSVDPACVCDLLPGVLDDLNTNAIVELAADQDTPLGYQRVTDRSGNSWVIRNGTASHQLIQRDGGRAVMLDIFDLLSAVEYEDNEDDEYGDAPAQPTESQT